MAHGGKDYWVAGDFSGFDVRMHGSFVRASMGILESLAAAWGYDEFSLHMLHYALQDLSPFLLDVNGDIISVPNGNPSG